MDNYEKKTAVVKIVKFVVTALVGIGTKKIVEAIIDNNIEPDKLYGKVTVNTASWVITGMATESTKNYTDAKVDELFATWLKVKEVTDEIKEAIEEEDIPVLESDVSVNSDI